VEYESKQMADSAVARMNNVNFRGSSLQVSWVSEHRYMSYCYSLSGLLARGVQAKLALTVAQCLSIHLSICVSVRDSLNHAYVRSIVCREPRRLPACFSFFCRVDFFHYRV